MAPDHIEGGLVLVAMVAAGILFKLWARRKQARDPEFAARVEQARAQARVEQVRAHMQRPGAIYGPQFAANRIVWVLGALGVVVANSVIEKHAVAWHLSDQQKLQCLIAVIALLVVAGFFADRALQRWLRSRKLLG
jgi:hypothetical protein